MLMRFEGGKQKVLTLSYDDGVVQDIRFKKILDAHGIKCTFNIDSGMYVPEETQREKYYGRMKLSEAKELYLNSGHEVAVHSWSHPHLELMKAPEMLKEIWEDRKHIEQTYGVIARGMAYPFGTYNETLKEVLRSCGIVYARTIKSTYSFNFPNDWLELKPTCRHKDERLEEMMDKFLRTPRHDAAQLFYMWGHTYEFDDKNNWHIIEHFCEKMGGKEDIWYATNIEVYDYVKAYEQLIVSADQKTVINPTATDLWVYDEGEVFCIKAGQTLYK